MDFLGLKARQRHQELVATLRKPSPPTGLKAQAVSGPLQPHDPAHPGSDAYTYPRFTVGTYRIWHWRGFAIYPTDVTYLYPDGPVPLGDFPAIIVSPGKFLEFSALYAELLRHLCRKGYVVLFVDADAGPLDCQHKRMAEELLEAVWKTLVKKIGGRVATPPQTLWWGHSIGAKVQALAAALTANRYYLRPTAIVAANFSNAMSGGPLCYDDALKAATAIGPDIWYSVLQGDRDTISGEDPRRLYDALTHLKHRQLVTAVSYPPDDLVADHEAPLTAPGPIAGRNARLDALDWWLYWKIVVGAGDFHFKGGPDKWAYGSEREDGGTDLAGHQVRHRVEAESKSGG